MRSDDRGVSTPATIALLRRWRALGQDVGVLVTVGDGIAARHPLISLNEDLVLEMGSVFKVFLLAAFARHVERGDVNWDQTFIIARDHRIPHSAVLEGVPDGNEIAARDLLVAMMGRSDNTATQMVLDALPEDAPDEVIGLAGLPSTVVNADLRSLHAQATADSLIEPRCCRSTAADMVRFYRFVLSGGMLNDPDVDASFRDILASEDRDQGFVWGSGITCLRKSGYVAPPPLLAVGFAGAMLGAPSPITFAFALNRHIDELAGKELAGEFGPVVRDTLLWALGTERGRG